MIFAADRLTPLSSPLFSPFIYFASLPLCWRHTLMLMRAWRDMRAAAARARR